MTSVPPLSLAAIRQPAFLYGSDGRIAEANDLAEGLAGRPLAGCSAVDIIAIFGNRHPDGSRFTPETLPPSRALAGEEAVDVPIVVTVAGGRVLHILATASPIIDGDMICGALVVWQDVSALAAVCAERGRHGQLLDTILGTLPCRVSLWDRDERLIWTNERFAAERGVSREALIGRSWRDLEGPMAVVEPLIREGLQTIMTGEMVIREVQTLDANKRGWRACTFLPFDGDALLVITEDITQRKQAELDLAFQALLLDRMNDAVIATDTALRVTAWNRAAEDLYGWTAGEAIGRLAREVTGADVSDGERQEHLACLNRGETVQHRVYQRHRDGRPLIIDGRSAPIHDPAGTLIGYVAVNRDVTERERLRDELVASEEKYRRLFETMNEGFTLIEPILDEQGAPVSFRHLEVNPAKERITHRTREELIGRDVRDVLPDMEPCWIETYGRVALTGEPAHLEEFARDLGVWLSVDAYSPEPGKAAVIVTNITARKEAETALRDSEERFRALYEHSKDAIVLVDPRGGGRILSANPAACRMLRWTEEELIGRSRDVVLDLGDPRLTAMLQERGRDGVASAEVTCLRRDGSSFPGELSTALFTDSRGDPRAVVIIRDITMRKAVELDLARYAGSLRRSNEELQRFAYVASHDLQEPLRSIVSFSQLLARRYQGQLDKDADEYLDFIAEGGNRMQALIQDLLQVSRVETGAKPLEPTDAAGVLAGALRLLEVPIREAGGVVQVDSLPRVLADAAQLEQVFSNLIGNAVKYGRDGVPPEVRISARPASGVCEFSVADNGIGIEAEYFDRIFEMFRRLHTHDKYGGTGIGLAVVKRIVDRHGGTIRVESTPGEGSTFFFTLPAA